MISMRSDLGRLSNGIIFRMMFVSHMLFRRTRNPRKTRADRAKVRMIAKTIKATMKLLRRD